jgi:hypothetical protein
MFKIFQEANAAIDKMTRKQAIYSLIFLLCMMGGVATFAIAAVMNSIVICAIAFFLMGCGGVSALLGASRK